MNRFVGFDLDKTYEDSRIIFNKILVATAKIV